MNKKETSFSSPNTNKNAAEEDICTIFYLVTLKYKQTNKQAVVNEYLKTKDKRLVVT